MIFTPEPGMCQAVLRLGNQTILAKHPSEQTSSLENYIQVTNC